MPTLAHKIRLDPTPDQIQYFKQASGTARFVWNWALDEWNRRYAAGQKPQAPALKKQFNALKYQQFPWLRNIHRDAHAQPFADLADAWLRFFTGQNDRPVFKKKGETSDSFYVANDKFQVADRRVKLPKIGWVRLRESLRFPGKILGARVVRDADQWFLSVPVSVPDSIYYRTRTGQGVEGVDVGVKTFATLSTGKKIVGPKAHRRALRRLKIRQRAITRKMQAAKTPIGLAPQDPLPQGIRLPRSRNWDKAKNHVARTHLRIAHLRQDFLHKTSTRLCRENQAVGIETLSVKGMMANHRLARSIADQGFGQFYALWQYKADRYGTQLIEADRWFPSSKLCSTPGCGYLKKDLTLKDRSWTCPGCGVTHDRDVNAAINLKGLATPTALPVATRPVRTATVPEHPDIGGKVTPARHEATPESLLSASGQEEVGAHHCAPIL
ncbi:MAG: RNA-guided endonuclease TnpB family protein [Thermaerobacter sp.]|nr:RNA-guided endonuclease TnpB family protein [Thermaerobacter sp.]